MKKIKNRKFDKGFSMLEMMVAILILSLGLLGVAGMELATAKYRINIQANSAISQLFSDLTERIRANANAAGPSFDPSSVIAVSSYVLNDKDYATQLTDTLTTSLDCMSNICSSNDRAVYDMIEWRKQVKNSLPQGAAWVEGDKKNGINVTLMWMDKGQTDNPADGSDRSLVKSSICASDTSDTIFNCCPQNANVIAGVQCRRVSLFP